MKLALKIDVDTYRGIAEGGNRLADYLSKQKVPASFFVTLGPDTSGRAIWRVFRHRHFLKKMRRTSAVDVYGWRTVLSGTLWPARPMAVSFAKDLRRWRALGFEVSPHGYDHIRWHDQAARWNEDTAARELAKVSQVYEHIFGARPRSFAAPGWQTGPGTWKAMEAMQLLYHSDTRGEWPCRAQWGESFQTLEIPTTLPTWDEMLAWDGLSAEDLVERTWALLDPARVNVWTVHAEFEGGPYFDSFRRLIEKAVRANVEWIFLPRLAEQLTAQPGLLPKSTFTQGERVGRAGTVTSQIAHG